MAIKGKRRGRSRTGRTVTTAPRPYLVPPKTPLMRRTGAKFVLVLLAEALVFALLVMADAQSDADRRREQVTEFTSLVEAQLYQGGAAQESFTGPVVLPQMGQAISQLQSGEGEPEDLAENTESWSEVAERAGNGIAEIDTDLAGLKEARNLMEQGLELYSGLAQQVGLASQLEGRSQRTMLETIGRQIIVAATIFDTGYGALQEERRLAGLPTSTSLPGGLPDDLGGLPPIPGG